jgi:hypothetical protein
MFWENIRENYSIYCKTFQAASRIYSCLTYKHIFVTVFCKTNIFTKICHSLSSSNYFKKNGEHLLIVAKTFVCFASNFRNFPSMLSR